MRVLLTGANGFVGSHVLDLLREGPDVLGEPVGPISILLRRTSDTRFIAGHLPHVTVHCGSLSAPDALARAVEGAECVIHCAGKTKALHVEEFYQVNQEGTRNLVRAVNANEAPVRHLVHVSTCAVCGPASANRPASEDESARPVSEYGRSKLLGEREVTERCEVAYTVLRPSAVYGPRDVDFLSAFRGVRARLMPVFGRGGGMDVSLVYARDVARAVLSCLDRPEAFGKTYNVAMPEPCTSLDLLTEIARQMRVRAVAVRVPIAALYPVCLVSEALSRITGKASILSRQKYQELKQPGWVCATARIREELGFVATTSLQKGVALTLDWYRRHGWL